MKITRIETIICSAFDGYTWVQIHTDDGLIGLGETNSGHDAVTGYVHEEAAQFLLGQDPIAIERHYATLSRVNHLGGMGHRGVGAEMRGLSAIDIALWDIFGQSVGLPIYRLLGGPVRDRIQLYNTCSGYVGIGYAYGHAVSGPYEDDYDGWQQGRAAELAKSLLDMGITAMKIWPFDKYADRPFDHIEGRNWAQHITPAQIDEGLQPFRDIRDAVGLDMDIGVELHHRWSLPAAIRIAEALDPFQPMWYEDPMPADSADELAEFARRTNVPLMASESLASRYAYRELLERGAVGIVNIDPTWVGGITESRRVCNLAEAYHRPFAPHDCAGPLDYVVGVHLCIALLNAMIQEGVRAHWDGGWYEEVITDIPDVERGYVAALDGPGLGTRLKPEFLGRSDLTVRASEL